MRKININSNFFGKRKEQCYNFSIVGLLLFVILFSLASSCEEENVNVLFEKWKKEARVRNVKIKTICTLGEIFPILKEYVDRNQIDFVVMGSHGHSAVKGFYIGSNCQKVVRTLKVPVFIVKDQPIKYEFKNVVYASNFNEEEKLSFILYTNYNPV